MLFVILGGDLKCCDLELPITSPVATTRLYLLSQTSGLVSFGRKKYEEERKSLNRIPVPVPVCQRCPDILVVCFDTTISPSKTSPRLTCHTLSLVCQPSFQVQCRRSGLLSFPYTFSQQFKVSFTNMATDIVRSMKSLAVSHVVVVSRDQRLALVQSRGAGCTGSDGESTSLSVQMALLERVEPQWQDTAGLNQWIVNVNIFCSDVRASGTAGQPGGRRGNPPVLGQDLCVVMWWSGGTSPSMRQTVVTVADGYEEEEVGELIVEDGVRVENELVESGLTNNFLTASEFCAKLEVVMEGMGKKWVLVEYRLKKQEGARARGNTGIRILVDVGNIISCGSSFQIV